MSCAHAQVEFQQAATVRRVDMSGGLDYSCYVNTFQLRYSQSGAIWRVYGATWGERTTFRGPEGRYRLAQHELEPPIAAKYVRVAPTSYSSRVCMRLELYGCMTSDAVVHDAGKPHSGFL